MTYIFVLTAGALLPALFAPYDIQETWIWRNVTRVLRSALNQRELISLGSREIRREWK
jgi:hypothetical protein